MSHMGVRKKIQTVVLCMLLAGCLEQGQPSSDNVSEITTILVHPIVEEDGLLVTVHFFSMEGPVHFKGVEYTITVELYTILSQPDRIKRDKLFYSATFTAESSTELDYSHGIKILRKDLPFDLPEEGHIEVTVEIPGVGTYEAVNLW